MTDKELIRRALSGRTGREREWHQHWHDSQAVEDCCEGRIFEGVNFESKGIRKNLQSLWIRQERSRGRVLL